jgi:hypothetical protein
MAFLRYAKANVVNPQLNFKGWDKVRVASGSKSSLGGGLVQKAQDILGEPCTPERFLLTHSTIVCSVDAVTVPNSKTGSIVEQGLKINRKYANWRVTSETDKFRREVIMKSYKTFIGAQNFLEHIQVEELSKGRIIDAVLRDVGESLYVDILVATDRKHTDLVNQIIKGEMNAMSMGCSVEATICTKCGHVAADETEFCPHVKYEKGNVFYDEQGNKHRVAELCGHEDMGETGGVTFIEASWVATPAFKGAVTRNILELPQTKQASEAILNQIPSAWLSKVAGPFDDEEEDAGEEAPAEPPKSLMQQLEDVYQTAILDRLRVKLENEIKEEQAKLVLNPPIDKSTTEQNDTVIKEGSRTLKKSYLKALELSIKTASSIDEAVLNLSLVNSHYGVKIPAHIYKLAQKLGSASNFKSVDSYLKQANVLHGSNLSESDKVKLIRFAKLLSLHQSGRK